MDNIVGPIFNFFFLTNSAETLVNSAEIVHDLLKIVTRESKKEYKK